MENFIIPITSIILSGVASMLVSQYFGRKNLKTSQYITVITSERIKWIEVVRNDMTTLISSVLIYLENSNKIMDRSEKVMELLYQAFDADEIEEQNRVSNAIEKELDHLPSKSEIVRKAILLKLKLNPKEDFKIIEVLDDIINVFSHIESDLRKLNSESVRCDSLVLECQKMLKREWDKVKDETGKK